MKQFKLIVISKNDKFESIVDKLIVNSENGELTILADHIPLITTLKKGKIVFETENKMESIFIEEGLMNVNRSEVIIFSNFKLN